jgi:thiol:disulfide interchange protein DsbC
MHTYRIAHGLACILIGVVFIYTGMIHIADPTGFAEAVAAYRILPAWSVNAFALILPWVELLAGLAITTGVGLEGGALAAIGMFAVFLIALALSLYRGLDISCGCYSTSAEADKISWLYLVRDLALLLVAVFIFLHPWIVQGKSRAFRPATKDRMLVILLVVIGVAGILLFQRLTRDPCEGVSLDSINLHKQFKAPVLLGKRSVNGLCEVLIKTENQIVPVYQGNSFVIAGGMFQDRRDITGEGLKLITSQKFLALKHEIDKAVAFTYTPPGPIRHTLYMFISPTCPHCEDLLSQVKPLLDETRTELRVLFTGTGEAEMLAIAALCRKVDLETYLSKQWMPPDGTERITCGDGKHRLNRSNDLSHRLGVTRVPTVFIQQGLMLEGPQLNSLKNLIQDKQTAR